MPAIGATMRVQDSLQAGKSRFFAEVTKVRQLLDLATRPGGPPLLFLLDELFAGTNSADRVAGAEGVVRALVEPPAPEPVRTAAAAPAEPAGNTPAPLTPNGGEAMVELTGADGTKLTVRMPVDHFDVSSWIQHFRSRT